MYHDLGNLNLSFLTSKAEYNRRRNLELVCAGVRRAVRGDLGVEINSRDDIVVAGDRNSAPSVPQPVVQSWRRPLLGPSPG